MRVCRIAFKDINTCMTVIYEPPTASASARETETESGHHQSTAFCSTEKIYRSNTFEKIYLLKLCYIIKAYYSLANIENI